MILYSQPRYERLAPWLAVFERRRPHRELAVERQKSPEAPPRVIVFGLGRYGEHLLARLQHNGVAAMGVDFDPETVRRLRHRGFSVRFGDGEDAAFLETLPLATADWTVTTLPTWEANQALLHALKEMGLTGRIAGVMRDETHGQALRAAGASRVINPLPQCRRARRPNDHRCTQPNGGRPMNRLQTLLAATDLSAPSRHAAQRAAMLARQTGARLELVDVLRKSALDELQRLFGEEGEALQGRIRA